MPDQTQASLSYSAIQVRQFDHDRFLTAIFAPAAVREHLFALYAFNIEIAKTGEVVSEPLIGQMRLQWWRDTLDRLYSGETIAHQVAQPLGAAIAACRLDRAAFERLITAREFDLDRVVPADFQALHDYAEGTGAPLLELALSAVGGEGDVARQLARQAGAAWALTGLLRAVPFHARQRRLYLPEDKLTDAGVRIGQLFELKPEAGLSEVVRCVGLHARRHFLTARKLVRQLPKMARSPALLAELGLSHLRDLERAGWDPFVLERSPARGLKVANLAFKRLFGGY